MLSRWSTTARWHDVPRLKACGLTIEDIASKLGTSRRPHLKTTENAGIDSRQVIFTDADRREMRRLHAQGLTVLQIHAAIGKATEQAVRYQLQGIGCLTKIARCAPER